MIESNPGKKNHGIPYKRTVGYDKEYEFKHDDFFEWAANNAVKKIERVYCNNAAKDLIK